MSKYTFTKNYIKEYKDFVPKDLANRIMTQKDLSFYEATTAGGKKSSHRNCLIKTLDTQFDQEIANVFSNAFKSYLQEFTFFDSIQGETTGWDHVLYLGDKAQEYKEHVDVSTVFEQRTLTCSLILNDNYDGGDLLFLKESTKFLRKRIALLCFLVIFVFHTQSLQFQMEIGM